MVAGGGRVGGSQLYGWWQQGVLAASHRVGGRRGLDGWQEGVGWEAVIGL